MHPINIQKFECDKCYQFFYFFFSLEIYVSILLSSLVIITLISSKLIILREKWYPRLKHSSLVTDPSHYNMDHSWSMVENEQQISITMRNPWVVCIVMARNEGLLRVVLERWMWLSIRKGGFSIDWCVYKQSSLHVKITTDNTLYIFSKSIFFFNWKLKNMNSKYLNIAFSWIYIFKTMNRILVSQDFKRYQKTTIHMFGNFLYLNFFFSITPHNLQISLIRKKRRMFS